MSYQIGNAALGVTFTGDLGSLQRTLDQAGGSVDQFGRRSTAAMRGVASEASRADDAMSRLANGIKGAFVGGSVAVGLIGLKNNIISATSAVIDAQIQLDRLNVSMDFAAGKQAGSQIAFMRAEVMRLGLDLGVTAGQFAKFSAATLSVGVPAEKANRIFSGVAQAAASLGLGAEQVDRAFNAVVQSFSKGQVMAEEIRGQWGEHIPGAFEMAAQAMGMTSQKLNKDMEAGLIKPLEFWSKYAEFLITKTDGTWQKSSQSMQAEINRLGSAWLNLKQQFSQSGPGGFISDQTQVLAGDLKVLGDVMEASRQRGEGFWMTVANTAGATAGRAAFGALAGTFNTFNGTVNALTGNVFGLNESLDLMPANLRSTAEQFGITTQKIQQAQQEYATLAARLAQAPDNIYIKSELGNLARYITRLKEAQDEQRRLMGGGVAGAGNESSAEAARLARQNTAAGEAIARRATQQSARDALLKRYASPAEKLNEELRTQKELLGDLFTPDIEARIRANFIKPTKAGGSAVRTVADEFERLSERLGTDLAAGAAQAQAAQQGLNTAQTDFLKLAASPVWDQLSSTQRADLALLYERRIAQEQMADSLKASALATEALARAEDDRIKGFTDAAGKATNRLDELRAEAQAMAYAEAHNVSLAIAIEQTAMARLREAQAAEMAKGTGMNDSVVLALQQEIDARRQIVEAIAGKEVREAGQKLREDQAAEWARTWDQVGQSFTDALMEGGKSVADYLKGLFRTLVLRPILAPIGTALASMLMPGTASAGQGGGGLGSLGSLQNLLNPSKIFSSFGDSLAFAADSAGQWLVNNTSGYLNQLGGSLMGNAGAIGTVGGYAGGAMAGIGIGRSISGGYSAIGKSGNTAVNTGTIIGSIFGGPIGGAIGGAIGGLVNRVFGRKLADSGFTGSYDVGGQFTGQSFEYYKGGTFRSDKTTYSELDPAIARTLTDQFAAIESRTLTAMRALGVTGINGFRGELALSTQGLSPEQASQRLAEEFARISDEQAMFVLGNDAYVRSGETASVTLQRLSTSLTGVNQVLDTLGLRAYAVSLASGDMASSLADLFGGLDAFAQASTAYYQAFYTQGERTATTTRQLTEALGQLGLSLPETRQAYRALVEAQDLTTEAGRSAYAALVQLAPTFAELAPAVDDLATALQQAGDSVAEEIKRLRGLNTTASADQGLAVLQARFATATASARAGSTSALAELPAISQALEEAAALQARTAAELALLRNQTAASLALTMSGLGLQVPAFDVGTNYVPRDMFARIHEGEAIVPKAYNPAAGGAAPGSDAMAAELRAVRQELAQLRTESGAGWGAVASHTAKTARILERAQPTGDALLTMTMAEFDAL